ncbi:MAG: lysylphosphatidylglycerol synthase domain-containing protein [Actinomycetes bacterium]
MSHAASPPQPYVHRPLDAAWAVGTFVVAVAVIALAAVTSPTLTGVGEDLAGLGDALPGVIVGPLTVASAIVSLLAAPAVFLVLLIRAQARVALLTLAAAAVGAGLCVVAGTVLRNLVDRDLQLAFTAGRGGLPDTWPFLAFLIAVLAVPRFSERSRIARLVRWMVGLYAVIAILDGSTTVASVVVSVLLAATAVNGTAFVAGLPAVPVDEATVSRVLAEADLPSAPISGDADALDRVGVVEAHDAYRVDERLDVVVLTRDRIGSGLLYRAWRRLRLRGEVQPPVRFSLRRSVERESLLAYAITASGARAPQLVASLPIRGRGPGAPAAPPTVDAPDAVALVVEHVATRPLADLAPEDIDDAVLDDAWRQLLQLRRAGIAHRRLTSRALRVDAERRVWIVGGGQGEIAADPVALNLDVAQALVELALLAGVDRAVRTALIALGPEPVAQAGGLLQPVLLTRETRTLLRGRREVLPQLRSAVGDTVELPTATPRLEKLRPRTIITGAALAVALYLVASSLAGVDVVAVLRSATPGWVAAAAVAMVCTWVGAALAVIGFVPEPIPLLRTIAVQVGLSVVRLVAPPAVGAVAVNARYLVRSGVSPAGAGASMAASQLVGLVVGLVLLPVLGTLTGQGVHHPTPGAAVVVGVLAVLAVAIALVAAWSPLRTRALRLLRNFTTTALPRLAEVAQQPAKLAQGLGGTVLITAGYVACLAASARAFGVEQSVALIAIVFLTGNTVGSALPTPGGLGAVEAVLTAGLTAIGVPAASAVPTVLLFRIMSFWLPLLPGWICWTALQRRRIV